jgi:hypothetical protein
MVRCIRVLTIGLPIDVRPRFTKTGSDHPSGYVTSLTTNLTLLDEYCALKNSSYSLESYGACRSACPSAWQEKQLSVKNRIWVSLPAMAVLQGHPCVTSLRAFVTQDVGGTFPARPGQVLIPAHLEV